MYVNQNDSEYVNFALCEPTGVPLMGGGPYGLVKGGSLKGGLIGHLNLKEDSNPKKGRPLDDKPS